LVERPPRPPWVLPVEMPKGRTRGSSSQAVLEYLEARKDADSPPESPSNYCLITQARSRMCIAMPAIPACVCGGEVDETTRSVPQYSADGSDEECQEKVPRRRGAPKPAPRPVRREGRGTAAGGRPSPRQHSPVLPAHLLAGGSVATAGGSVAAARRRTAAGSEVTPGGSLASPPMMARSMSGDGWGSHRAPCAVRGPSPPGSPLLGPRDGASDPVGNGSGSVSHPLPARPRLSGQGSPQLHGRRLVGMTSFEQLQWSLKHAPPGNDRGCMSPELTRISSCDLASPSHAGSVSVAVARQPGLAAGAPRTSSFSWHEVQAVPAAAPAWAVHPPRGSSPSPAPTATGMRSPGVSRPSTSFSPPVRGHEVRKTKAPSWSPAPVGTVREPLAAFPGSCTPGSPGLLQRQLSYTLPLVGTPGVPSVGMATPGSPMPLGSGRMVAPPRHSMQDPRASIGSTASGSIAGRRQTAGLATPGMSIGTPGVPFVGTPGVPLAATPGVPVASLVGTVVGPPVKNGSVASRFSWSPTSAQAPRTAAWRGGGA